MFQRDFILLLLSEQYSSWLVNRSSCLKLAVCPFKIVQKELDTEANYYKFKMYLLYKVENIIKISVQIQNNHKMYFIFTVKKSYQQNYLQYTAQSTEKLKL